MKCEGEPPRGTGGALASSALTVQRDYFKKVSSTSLSRFMVVVLFSEADCVTCRAT